MRQWLKGKSGVLHLWDGPDVACLAKQLKGMNTVRCVMVDKPTSTDRICQACQFVIAERRGKF